MREKKPIARIHVQEKKPIALNHVREKKLIARIYVREKGILMDLLTRMLEEKWSRGSAHGVWRRGKQTVERETIPSLISDKGKIDIFNPQALFFCHIHRGTTCLFTYCAIVFALGNTIKKKK